MTGDPAFNDEDDSYDDLEAERKAALERERLEAEARAETKKRLRRELRARGLLGNVQHAKKGARRAKSLTAVEDHELLTEEQAELPEPEPAAQAEPPVERVFKTEKDRKLWEGRVACAKSGRHISGPVPFGFWRDSQCVLHVDDAEAEIVRLIFRTYLKRRSVKRTVDFLNGQGYRTRRQKLWSRPGVHWILTSRVYVGRIQFGNGVDIRGQHEMLIAPIVFNKTHLLLKKQRKSKPRVQGPTQTA